MLFLNTYTYLKEGANQVFQWINNTEVSGQNGLSMVMTKYLSTEAKVLPKNHWTSICPFVLSACDSN